MPTSRRSRSKRVTEPGRDRSVSRVTRVAVLGGGQLGRMLGLAGIPLGLVVHVPRPGRRARRRPSSAISSSAALDDVAAARRAAKGADVVTYEWEGVPAPTARALAAIAPGVPAARALEVVAGPLDREDDAPRRSASRPRRSARSTRDVDSTPRSTRSGCPRCSRPAAAATTARARPCCARPADVDARVARPRRRAAHPRRVRAVRPRAVDPRGARPRRRGRVLARGRERAPRRHPARDARARAGPRRRAASARRGVHPAAARRRSTTSACCCVELFDVGGELLANEIAPRVHNSGHWTIEGAETSQFENHVRAVLGLPLGSTARARPSAMVNCIGAMPDRDAVLAIPGAHLHDYGKAPRPGASSATSR